MGAKCYDRCNAVNRRAAQKCSWKRLAISDVCVGSEGLSPTLSRAAWIYMHTLFSCLSPQASLATYGGEEPGSFREHLGQRTVP